MTDEKPCWWAGTSEEWMDLGGPFATRDDAIAEGRAQQDGEPFFVMQAHLHQWSPPRASSVMDLWADSSDEFFYEDSFGGFEGGKEAEAAAENDLKEVLAAWFERHKHICPRPTAFAWSGAAELIDAAVVEDHPHG